MKQDLKIILLSLSVAFISAQKSILANTSTPMQYQVITQDEGSTTVDDWAKYAKEWTKGDGTKENPYLIETPNQLAYLGVQVRNGNAYAGKYFRQTANLDFGATDQSFKNFLPIGIYDAGTKRGKDGKEKPYDDSHPFNGVYDGNNHKISNLRQDYHNEEHQTVGGHGLFGFIGHQGQVLNLTLDNTCTFSGAECGGSFASYQEGKLTNCHSSANVEGNVIEGGIVSVLLSGSIENSSFTGKLKGSTNIGGLVGSIDLKSGSSTIPTIKNSFVNATIICTGFYPGGAIGMLNSRVNMSNCYFVADIKGDGNENPTFGGKFIGGSDKEVNIKNSIFSSCFVDQDVNKMPDLIGDGNKAPQNGLQELHSAEMKTAEFIQKLGDSFTTDTENTNNGYPILKKIKSTPAFTSYPTNESIRIRMHNGVVTILSQDTDFTIELYDLQGKQILRGATNQIILPHHGIYILKVNTLKTRQSLKVIF